MRTKTTDLTRPTKTTKPTKTNKTTETNKTFVLDDPIRDVRPGRKWAMLLPMSVISLFMCMWITCDVLPALDERLNLSGSSQFLGFLYKMIIPDEYEKLLGLVVIIGALILDIAFVAMSMRLFSHSTMGRSLEMLVNAVSEGRDADMTNVNHPVVTGLMANLHVAVLVFVPLCCWSCVLAALCLLDAGAITVLTYYAVAGFAVLVAVMALGHIGALSVFASKYAGTMAVHRRMKNGTEPEKQLEQQPEQPRE